MNEKYIQKKAQLIALNEYQAELTAQNYLASLRQRVVIQLNSGSTVFSLPLFLSDYYTLDSKKPYSKDRRDKKANELAIWEGQQMTPDAFHKKLQRDILEEYDRAYPLIQAELEQNRPLESDYKSADDQEYIDAIVRFEAKKATKLMSFRKDFDLIQEYVSFFTPFKPVYYDNLFGMFIGYKILNTGTKLKYTKGNIEFIFCFLSHIPIFHTKLTAVQGEELLLKTIKDSTNLFLSPASSGGMSAIYITESVKNKRKIEEWKPEINKRIIRRFMAGNILSGIVEANSQKKKNLIKRWSLTRFTMIDGTTNTAVELKYETELSDKVLINPKSESLSISSGNNKMLEYINKIPVSTNFDYSQLIISLDIRAVKDLYPIWNYETEKVCDRAIGIIKREYSKPTIEFQIIQIVKSTKDKITGRKLFKEVNEKEIQYNNIYHDAEFQAKFGKYLLDKNPKTTQLAHIYYSKPSKKTKSGYEQKFTDTSGYIKTYQFVESNEAALKEFLGELHQRYDVSFNFRSDVASYFNIEEKGDPFDKASKKIISAFPVGKYHYRFTKQVTSDVKAAIPEVIEETFDSTNGGIVLPLPMQPSRLSSYSLKPVVIGDNSIPLDILIKMTLSEFNEEDKNNFAQELEKRVEVDNEDDYEVGKFVRKFINERTVGTLYCFGDLQVDDIGKIFRDYALKQDLAKLIFEEKQQEEQKIEAAKQKIASFEDAEKFILSLLK
jgi:hypothetical protein